MFVLSPLHYLENQASDLLLTIAEMTVPPRMDNSYALAKVYMLYSLCQGLSSCVYQSLSDVDNFIGPKSHTAAAAGVLTRRARRHSSSAPDNMFDTTVNTAPSRWPGVDNIVALLSRGDMHGDETPTSPLRLLLAECTVAVYTALFAYALAACDSRWLYRLSTHTFDARQFAAVFGGGGEKRLSAAKSGPSIVKQQRPNRPPPVKLPPTGLNVGQRAGAVVDSAALRAKFHAKVFGNESPISVGAGSGSTALSERTVMRFVSPKLNLVQFFASKPAIRSREELGVDYDSDESIADDNENSDENQQHHDDDDDGVDVDDADDEMQMRRRQHSDPNSYAWAIMRLALVKQLIYRLRQFLVLIGFEINELTSTAPRIDLVMKLLDLWTETLDADVRSAAVDGCPKNFIPHSSLDQSNNHVGLSLWKYRTIIEPGNSPFNVDDATSLPVRRLWTYLVRQEHLMDIFIRHIFGSSQKSVVERSAQASDEYKSNGTRTSATPPLETFKIVQRELEAVVAFAVSQIHPGWIVVSTGRELQEMDISALLTNAATDARWLTNPTELDIALADMKKDTLKDNDDYQLLLEREQRKQISASFLLKRQVTGIRRMDAHPSLPYYVSGSSDGSIRLWEWGVGQPLYTPRPVGQYAKVTKVAFSANGNKFAAVDGDGLLCLWQASHGNPIRKPFFNQKCHTKSAADVRFLGATSSLLVTAGHGSGDQNLALWDTLLPSSKAMIHTWNCHPEGANCCMYVPAQQTIVSGGRHGELCFWDVRMRALRTQLKVFDNAAAVKTLIADPGYEMFVVASSDGDIKIWSIESAPQLLYTLNGEHGTRSGFSLRTVAGGAGIQGVQQIYVDNQLRMFSCGADCSLKLRQLPSMFG